MFSKAQVLNSSQKILGAESSERSGTVLLGTVLKEVFPLFNWESLPVHSESTVYYFETIPEKKKVDLVCYVNVDTANPSHLSLWRETDFDPLSITVKSGCIYGLGAAHEKISIVPQLLALESALGDLIRSNINILFAAGYGSETKMRGARRLLSEVLKEKKAKRVCIGHPTSNKIILGSAGQVKTKVFFPFSDKEKALRSEHDLKENILSQSKVYSYRGGEGLKENTIFQMIESCKYLPQGTVILDLDGGAAPITDPETTYFEVDLQLPFEGSMVVKFEKFGDKLMGLEKELISKFSGVDLKKAIHIGRCFDSDEGVTFFGSNLIPAQLEGDSLESWFQEFTNAVQTAGGQVMITDARAPYINRKRVETKEKTEPYCLAATEANLFSKYCEDIVFLGPGKEGLAKKPNESVSIDELLMACDSYFDLFKEIIAT